MSCSSRISSDACLAANGTWHLTLHQGTCGQGSVGVREQSLQSCESCAGAERAVDVEAGLLVAQVQSKICLDWAMLCTKLMAIAM